LGSAARWAEKAVELSERDPGSLVTWAELLAETGSPEKALAIASEAEPRVKDERDRARLVALRSRLAAGVASRPPEPTLPAPGAPKASGPEKPVEAGTPAPPPPPPPAPPPPSQPD